MSDLRLLAILENIDKLEGAVSCEYLRDLCKQAAKEITELNALRLRRGTQAEKQELTDEQIDSACLSVRHDFWSLPVRVQDYIRFQATEWAEALAKARGNK
jgi:hypothetical protein